MAGSFTEAAVVMPMWKRASITGIQLLVTLITAGVIIGYGQLYPILVDTGVYHYKCGQNTNSTTVCPEQKDSIDLLFNVGASVSIFVQAPSGVIINFLGPLITCLAGLVLFIPGCFLFAFADSITAIDAYMCGFQLLAAGGPFVFISCLPVAQLWPDKKATIFMMINGVYGGGAFVFFLFALLHYQAHISMRILFIVYGFVGCLLVVIVFFVWPRRSYSDKKTESIEDLEEELTPLQIIVKSKRDIITIDYMYLACTIAFMIFASNFFLDTSAQQFSLHLSNSQFDEYNTIFGVVLPGVGMLAGITGLLFDKYGENVALVVLIALATICSICGLVVISGEVFAVLQIIRMFVFSIYFPMIYGIWAFFIIAKFGTSNFGVLYGIIAILAGIVNITGSNPLVQLSLSHNSFVFANVLLGSIGLLFVIYPIACLVMDSMRRRALGSGYYEPI